ncbi:isochorismatase family protein [Streptomyces sp. NPDC091272]|uniref:isochorismatase family protein n=1 Tax=Streptomyces sp. NPDC091272 TaxID=3365981 RepID=UPI00380327BB
MPLLDVDDCALVVIDVQSDFYPAKRLDVDRLRLNETVQRIAWIAAAAAELKVPTVVTEEEPDHNERTEPVIVKALAADAQTFPKNAFAVSDNPNIAAGIEGTGRNTLVLVGLETDICVAHSALQLQAAGKRVVVVDDATFSPGPAHPAGLRRLAAAGIETLSTKELFYDWVRTIERANAFHRATPHLPVPPGLRF